LTATRRRRSLKPIPQGIFLGLLCLASSGCARRAWNVVLVTFDTTRADFLGCYGKETAQTPNLDRLAAEGFLFEHAYTSNPVTQAAHATILTGVYPMVHGVRDNTFFHLPDGRTTLAEILAAHGYDTAAAIGGFPLTKEFGTAQGFDLYDDDLTADRLDQRGRPVQRSRRTWYDERPAGHVNDAILPWLRGRGGAPFFIWLHYWDPHEPHIPPPPYDQLFAYDAYQGEIAYADESLGTILRVLEEMGEAERTLIVMTADHGEGRLEHQEMTHAFLAYDATIHVPLIMRIPGRDGGRRILDRVGTVDIVPTVLDLLGIDGPPELQGRSLEPLTRGVGHDSSRDYYAESLSPRLSHGFGELRVLFRGPYKLIYGPRPELFNLEDDPRELRDLSGEMSLGPLEDAMQTFLTEHASPDAADAAHEVGLETMQQLAALGYLSGYGDSPDAVGETLRSDGEAPQDRVGDINLVSRLRNELAWGRFRRARATAEQLLRAAPGNAFYRAKLVAANLGLGETEEAARLVDETETITAANVDDYLRVASVLFWSDQRERGLAMARRLVTAQESADGRLLLARLELESGEDDAFLEDVARTLGLDPENVEARLMHAEYLSSRGSLRDSEHELDALLAEHPAFAAGHLAYARVLEEAGRKREALERLGRAISFAPRWCEAHLERLELLVELEGRDSSEEAMITLRRNCRDRETLARAAELTGTR
jgi:arylsulfatase A-like enzyme